MIRCAILFYVDCLVSILRWSKPPHHVKVNPLGEVKRTMGSHDEETEIAKQKPPFRLRYIQLQDNHEMV
jgi:hypothetical protein